MMDRDTQCRAILRYMSETGPITQRIASELFGCDRLASRICDLKQSGVQIASGWDYKIDADGKVVKRWKRYWIGGCA